MKKKLLVLATAGACLLSPLVQFAQAPNLGTSANFVLFTTVGAVTNTGVSQLTGNVGSNSGSSTNFGNVNGVMHDGDGASAQAAADLLLAYNQLNSTIPQFFPAPLLGNGATLTAGVYSIGAPTVLSGDLTLDAQGVADAVFIFQIAGTFSTDVSSKIKLVNGAQSCNIFWKVEGAVSMASKTFMRGTIVAHNGAIGMNVNDTLEGRALSIAGAVAVDGVLAYTPPGCGKVQLTGPAAPNLGTAFCYAVFSGNGSIVNSGISNITGDVGTNVGLTGGFDPLLVKGTIHPIPDGSTAAAASDLVVAYNYLNTLPHDIELLYPAQFGRNLVLTPHTYLMNEAADFKDSLYLNAEGNTNAVFVIKLKGALSTSTFSKVLLINGTQAQNVYWVIDGAVGINDYSIFNGTIVCNNGAINVATGVTINGRALTTGGALSSTASMNVLSPGGDCRPLPVSWLYFRGKPVQKNVLLEWGTSNEMNNGFFTIEKSLDGLSFTTLTNVNATKALTAVSQNYSVTDQQPYGNGYYRISQTDKDGRVIQYKTIAVNVDLASGFYARSYVSGNYIYVPTSGAVPGRGSIELFSIEGKRINSQNVSLTKEATTFKIVKPLLPGIYLFSISAQGKKLFTGKVTVL